MTFRAFLIYFLIGISILFYASNAQDNQNFKFRKVENKAFDYGERLDFEVTYSFIVAGTGYFHILPVPAVRNNRPCYDIRFQVSSLKSLEWIYKVRDSYRTLLDVEGIFPWEFEQHIREGNYKKDYTAVFDQVNNFAISGDKKVKVPPYIHDIVSAFFYVRTMNLKALKNGEVFFLENFIDEKVYKLGVKIHTREIVEVPCGKFKCIKIEPLVTEGGLFKSEGKIYVWLTDDENKIPVKVATKILIGYVSSVLVKYSGVRNPMTAKIE